MLMGIKKYLSSVTTSIWINSKNLRMNFLEYLMLVILFPLTYLIISITSSESIDIMMKISGLCLSVMISLFVNMQGTLVANTNTITTRELYASYGVKPINVFDGISVFHSIMSLPLIIVVVIVSLLRGNSINAFQLIIWLLIAFTFLSELSILLGGLIRNPRIATPTISMIYMILIIICPLYYSVPISKKILLINPFSWFCESFRMMTGVGSGYNFWISILILTFYAIIFRILAHIVVNSSKAIEKNTII